MQELEGVAKKQEELVTFINAKVKESEALVSKRNALMVQQNENESVQKEVNLLEEGAKIYKMTGLVLVEQPLKEVKENVKNRLNFITNELKGVDVKIKEAQSSQVDKRKELIVIQDQIRKMAMQMQQGKAN